MILGKIQINLYHPFNPILFFIVFLGVVCSICDPVSANCPTISDDPMEIKIQSASPNIMFVLDNSGSMDWEFMTSESDGVFDDKYYLYPDSAYINKHDRIYPGNTILSELGRRKWKSQWCGYNKIFYNPNITYIPWPTMEDASITEPLANPSKSNACDSRFNLGGIFYTIDPVEVIVDNSDFGFMINNSAAWQVSDSTPRGDCYGEDYHLSSAQNSSVNDWVRWTPTLPKAGTYKVAVNWISTAGRDSSTLYTIVHNQESDTSAPQDLQKNGGQWNEIGEYEFNAGGNEYVQLIPDLFDGCCRYSADAVKFYIPCLTESVKISNAHYFVLDDLNSNHALDEGEAIYLVNFIDSNGDNVLDTRHYYLFDDMNNNNIVDAGELRLKTESEIPNAVRAGVYNEDGSFDRYADIDEDLQNFANWFSYYRKRALVVKAAVARSIYNLEGVYTGIYSINPGLRQPVLSVKVEIDSTVVDETQTLLNLLYQMDSSGGTPLRTALQNVGRYFDQTDRNDGGLGKSPYFDALEGGACQQAFCIVITDGFWNGDNPFVGNQDANSGSPFDGPPYADSYSDTLADVAMYYYKKDLSSTLDNIVPTNPWDSACHQHMVTCGVSFGVSGSLNPSDYHSCLLDGGTPPWPDPYDTEHPEHKIDDLWHASVNGRGLFFTASNPQELASSLVDMMNNIEYRVSSGASVLVNGREFNASTVLYQASYKSSNWTGDVTAYPINPSTGEIQRESGKIKWRASDKLEDIGFDDRRILSFNSESMAGITFRFSSLTDDQRLKLNNDPKTVDYIRGKEISGFRPRTGKLGDIVNSAPLLMGKTIYAGGNDGMLHAFDAATGVERFAYVPELLLANFYNETIPEKSFTAPGYEHVFFVDGSPVAGKGVLRGTKDPGTLLVGGLGKGGKGYFGIDITNTDKITPLTPEESLTETILWEFPPSADNDIGYTYSTPVIVKCNADLDGDTFFNDWVVIFGNGYGSINGDAALYIIKPDGTLLKKINTGQTSCNGLSSPSVIDINNDGRADYAYAGDLKGNLWKFDLTGDDPDDWGVAYGTADSPKPLIQIPGKPITSKPDVMRHCEAGTKIKEKCTGDNKFLTGFIVVFGTGKFLDKIDRSSTETQFIFGIWDYGDRPEEYLGVFDRNADPYQKQLSNQSEDVTLLEQTEIDNSIIDGVFIRTLSQNVPDWTALCDQNGSKNPNPAAHAGWFFDLPTPGERIIQDVMILDGRIIYLTFTPNASPCSGGGNSMIHGVDACSGGRLSYEVFDVNGDKRIDQGDLIDIGLVDKDGNPIMAAPAGLRRSGMLHLPAFLRMPDDQREMKIFSTSSGRTETLFKTAERLGIYYWIER